MSAWLKSRRLRRRALLRWALLVLPLAYLVSRIWSVDGLSIFAQFLVIVCVAILPFLLIHLLLSYRNSRRKTNRSKSPLTVSAQLAKVADLKSDTKADAKADAKAGAKADAKADAKVGAKPGPDTDTAGIDLDGTFVSPEDLQIQVEGVGDVVQTHDLGRDDLVRIDEESATRADRVRRDQLSDAGTSLVIATSHADTTNLSALTHTEATQLVATLQKDKTRLHRLVIAQQAAIDSERKAHDRSRSVARDAIKIMRDSREGQKQAEKLARREHSKRKRLEMEYRKVSNALDNAKSIIAARASETV